jgi:hypothetical protein
MFSVIFSTFRKYKRLPIIFESKFDKIIILSKIFVPFKYFDNGNFDVKRK